MRIPEISYLTQIHFGWGMTKHLPEILSGFGVSRPLVITDPGLAGRAGTLGLKDSVVFDGVETNPTEASMRRALQAYQKSGSDGIVALGGGSPIDLAKCVALMASHPEPLAQYAVVNGGGKLIKDRLPPLVAIPTTAGSGSEVGRAALLTIDSGEKLGFLSPCLLPKAAICDPEWTMSMPPLLTAGTGMDAVAHCVEAFCSPRWNPVADAIALEGWRRAWQALPKSAAGSDREAKFEMMLASVEAGLSFQKGLGAVHSLSHPLGALTGKRLHHGTLNAVFLPHVLRFNAAACPEKLDQLAAKIGLRSGLDLPDALTVFNREIGLPARLSEMGVAQSDLEALPEKALRDHCTPTNPAPLSVESCRALYQAAL